MVTVFKILKSGSKKTIEPLFGPLRGILVSDRDSSLAFWAMERRQICWAHLLRKFVSFSERDGPAGEFGREFLGYTGLVFEYWQAQKAGEITPELYRAWMAPVREGFEDLLERASRAGIARAKAIIRHPKRARQSLRRENHDRGPHRSQTKPRRADLS